MQSLPTGRSKIYKLRLPMYRQLVEVCVTDNVLAAVQKYIKNSNRTKPIRAVYYTLEAQGRSMLFLPIDIEPGELAHECYHMSRHIMGEIGATGSDEEFVAYLLGYLVEKTTEIVEKAKKALDKDKI
jgi:hypothetical protein